MKMTKKQVVKELKKLLDENRTKIERYGFQLIDNKGDLFKEELLSLTRDEAITTKPYACRLFVDIKYTNKSWKAKK